MMVPNYIVKKGVKNELCVFHNGVGFNTKWTWLVGGSVFHYRCSWSMEKKRMRERAFLKTMQTACDNWYEKTSDPFYYSISCQVQEKLEEEEND